MAPTSGKRSAPARLTVLALAAMLAAMLALGATLLCRERPSAAAAPPSPGADQPTRPPEWLGAAARAPVRVISLAPSLTEIVFALGRGARVVGVTRFDDWPPAVKDLPKVGGFVDPEPEAVLSLRPDVVLSVPLAATRARVENLARLGAPVLVVPAETKGDLWQAIDTLGALLGAEQEAAALMARLRSALAAEARAARAEQPLRVLVVVGHRPLVAAGPGSFLDSLLSELNATNTVTRGGSFPMLDLEAVAAARPDVIIEATMGEDPPEGLWDDVRAVLTPPPRVARVKSDALLRPGPRLPEGVRTLARALRPR